MPGAEVNGGHQELRALMAISGPAMRVVSMNEPVSKPSQLDVDLDRSGSPNPSRSTSRRT
jgi:hypothetical protein